MNDLLSTRKFAGLINLELESVRTLLCRGYQVRGIQPMKQDNGRGLSSLISSTVAHHYLERNHQGAGRCRDRVAS